MHLYSASICFKSDVEFGSAAATVVAVLFRCDGDTARNHDEDVTAVCGTDIPDIISFLCCTRFCTLDIGLMHLYNRMECLYAAVFSAPLRHININRR